MLRREWPLHRGLHSYVGATATGLVTGLATHTLMRLMSRFVVGAADNWRGSWLGSASRNGCIAALVGGLVGGASHTLLDSIMHEDIQPFWPFAVGNGLFHAVSVPALHFGCVIAALLGFAIMFMNRLPQGVQKDQDASESTSV